MPITPTDRRRSVVVLVFDGVRLLDVTGPLEVFDVARSMGASYDVTVCSPDGADVTTSGGLRLGGAPPGPRGGGADATTSGGRRRGAPRPAAEVGRVDTLVVPGGEVLVDTGPPAGLLDSIRLLATG